MGMGGNGTVESYSRTSLVGSDAQTGKRFYGLKSPQEKAT